MSSEKIKNLEHIAREIRRDVIKTTCDCAEGDIIDVRFGLPFCCVFLI